MKRGPLHNVTFDVQDFLGKPFPCPLCNMELRLKISCKQKPYCVCLECGIRIFFRGHAGIHRLSQMIRSEQAVVLEFSGPARAVSLYSRLQHLQRQKEALEKKQGFIFRDPDRREEVKKGMREKAEQGIFPSRPPFGYRNNKAERAIEIQPENSPIVKRIFELYASGHYSLSELRRVLRSETGKTISKAHLHTTLTNPFYMGNFVWGGRLYRGTHPTFISPDLYDGAQRVLQSHNKPEIR